MRLAISLLPHLIILAFVLFIYVRHRTMKKQQEALMASLQGHRFWRINLARPEFFSKWLRFMAFEAKGVLIDEGDALVIKGHWQGTMKPFESRLPRDQVRVEWMGNKGLRTGNLHWAKLISSKGEVYFSADTGLVALQSREALSDIFRAAFPGVEQSPEQTSDFALEKNPRTLLLIALMAILGLGALLDTAIFSQFELIESQLLQWWGRPLVWIGALLAMFGLTTAVYAWQVRGAVPSREAMTLSTMLSLVVIAATVPVVKRVDQVLMSGQSQMYAYRLVSPAFLEPEDDKSGLPRLQFKRMKDYWAQFEDGSQHEVPLLRGPSGLWQLDHAHFDPPIIAFYEKQKP